MNGTIQNLDISGYRCSLYLPQGYGMDDSDYPVVYINGEYDLQEIIGGVEPHFGADCEAFICVGVLLEDWNYSFSPWPAPALTKKSGPFGGGASDYINSLTGNIKPYIDAHYRTNKEPGQTGLIGYSLAGLVALYGLYTSNLFGKIASLSGSLWYDGWIEYMASNVPADTCAKVYLSLGIAEEHSRNQRMAGVGDCTRKAADILGGQLTSSENLKLEWNNGGHFTEIPDRFRKAILWLMG